MYRRGVLTLTIFFFFSVVEESRCIMEVRSSPVVPARSTYLIFLFFVWQARPGVGKSPVRQQFFVFVGEESRRIMEVGSSPDVPTRSTYPYNIFFL